MRRLLQTQHGKPAWQDCNYQKKSLAITVLCDILEDNMIRRLKKGVGIKSTPSYMSEYFLSGGGGAYLAKKELYEQKTEALLLPMMEEHQFELVDVEFVKEAGTWFLRAYIDKPGGITIDDCEVISRALSDRMDEEDFIEEAYILEVSSPGLGRPLKKDKDLERSLGESVDVKLFRAMDRQKEFTGILKAWDKDTVTLEFEEEAELVIERSNIALIRLAFDF